MAYSAKRAFFVVVSDLSKIVRDDCDESSFLAELKEQCLGGQALPSWLHLDFSISKNVFTNMIIVQGSLTRKARQIMLPGQSLKKARSIRVPPNKLEVSTSLPIEQRNASTLQAVASDVVRALKTGVTEQDDPRLFWNPDVKGDLPRMPLFDPDESFDRSGVTTDVCALCRRSLEDETFVWGGKVLFWVHPMCARKAWSK